MEPLRDRSWGLRVTTRTEGVRPHRCPRPRRPRWRQDLRQPTKQDRHANLAPGLPM